MFAKIVSAALGIGGQSATPAKNVHSEVLSHFSSTRMPAVVAPVVPGKIQPSRPNLLSKDFINQDDTSIGGDLLAQATTSPVSDNKFNPAINLEIPMPPASVDGENIRKKVITDRLTDIKNGFEKHVIEQSMERPVFVVFGIESCSFCSDAFDVLSEVQKHLIKEQGLEKPPFAVVLIYLSDHNEIYPERKNAVYQVARDTGRLKGVNLLNPILGIFNKGNLVPVLRPGDKNNGYEPLDVIRQSDNTNGYSLFDKPKDEEEKIKKTQSLARIISNGFQKLFLPK